MACSEHRHRSIRGRNAALALAGLVGLFGCDRVGIDAMSADDVPGDVVRVAASYRDMTRLTPERVPVDPELAAQCAPVTESQVAAYRAVSGPHAHTAVSIYMNEPAARAFATGEATFPVGSVIVKEKQSQRVVRDDDRQRTLPTRDGVGGMVKRPPGYDPDHGDWEYFYFEDVARIESGRIASCVECHQTASRDHVFGEWHHHR